MNKTKELPKPMFLVEVSEVVEDFDDAMADKKNFEHEGLKAKVSMNTSMSCFGCGQRNERMECTFGLYHAICPIGALFNHIPEKFEELKRKLAEMGFDVSWLDEYYQYKEQL